MDEKSNRSHPNDGPHLRSTRTIRSEQKQRAVRENGADAYRDDVQNSAI